MWLFDKLDDLFDVKPNLLLKDAIQEFEASNLPQELGSEMKQRIPDPDPAIS